MSHKQNKPQFNVREYVQSDEYLTLRSQITAEINSNKVDIDKTKSNTIEEIKKAKKEYNKLKTDKEAFEITRDELLTSLVNSAKKEYKSNFVLII